jgi:hypothetical protein
MGEPRPARLVVRTLTHNLWDIFSAPFKIARSSLMKLKSLTSGLSLRAARHGIPGWRSLLVPPDREDQVYLRRPVALGEPLSLLSYPGGVILRHLGCHD